MKFVHLREKELAVSLPWVGRPNGSETGQPMLNNSSNPSLVLVAVLTGNQKSLMGKSQYSKSPSSALIRIISVRLVTHLYSEHLLDQDHYLDWVVASFRDSDLDALPMWLFVMQIHQQDVHQPRQRGRRLAEALLKHIDKVRRPCGSHKNSARAEANHRCLYQSTANCTQQFSSNSPSFS